MDRQRFSRRSEGSKNSESPPRSVRRDSALAVPERYTSVSARDEYGSWERASTPIQDIEKVSRGNAILEGIAFDRSGPPSSPNRMQLPARDGSRTFLTRSPLENCQPTARSSRDIVTRPRKRTMENQLLEHSPSLLKLHSRHRIGSVHSTGASAVRGMEETHSSIGHPSSAPPPSRPSSQLNDERPSSQSRLSMSQPRHRLSINRRSATQTLDLSFAPTTDRTRIVELMRSTCGRMQGTITFRREGSTSWSSAYCYINEESGSLTYEPKSDATFRKTLVPDLRGCQVTVANHNGMHYLEVSNHASSIQVHLRAATQEEVDLWYAALLTWQPIRPRGIQNRRSKPQAVSIQGRRLAAERHHSDTSTSKNSAIIKVGKMRFFEARPAPHYSASLAPEDSSSSNLSGWIKTSCTLRENGELNIYTDQPDRRVTLYTTIQLSQLPRSSVQLLHPSLSSGYCVAIYPRRSSSSASQAFLSPIFLSYETRVMCEVWFVLLKVLCTPELYGPWEGYQYDMLEASSEPDLNPKNASLSHMFRMDRLMSIRIIEAKLQHPRTFSNTEKRSKHGHRVSEEVDFGFYTELLLDGELRARTTLSYSDTSNTFWREDFEFADLPATLSTVRLAVRARRCSCPLQGSKAKHRTHSGHLTQQISDTPSSPDLSLGQVDIYLDDLESNTEAEKWWTLTNNSGQVVGDVLIKIRTEEVAILMARDYQPLSELLHRFSNGLTSQIAQMMPTELRKLSEILLDIFQVSGQAADWLMVLVEEEIDGLRKESAMSRLRLSRRLGSADSDDSSFSAGDRELLLRDLGKSATLESAMLFRGNSLLTKSLDAHMKRLGKEYLDGVLGDVVREINMQDSDCEVDPSRVRAPQDLERNWHRLLALTKRVWGNIRSSATNCPPELRLIFRHIRACAEDGYGAFLRTVSYSSVSGFLFLRFFCPAILNPKLFGLLRDNPKPRAHRTMTLIAKAIQGLGNLTSFGAKELWMEPMNQFLSHHRQELKDFLDQICAISADLSAPPMPPSYATPLTIMNRLSQAGFSQEGFPSLPYLIDHARSFAALVTLWFQNSGTAARNIQRSDGDLLKFHELCVKLHDKTMDCLNRAERAERPGSLDFYDWEDMVEKTLNGSAALSVQDDDESALSVATSSIRDENDLPSELRTNGSTSFDGSTQFSPDISKSSISIRGGTFLHPFKEASREKERASRFGDFMAARRRANLSSGNK